MIRLVKHIKTIGQILKMTKGKESPIVSELIEYIKQQEDLIDHIENNGNIPPLPDLIKMKIDVKTT